MENSKNDKNVEKLQWATFIFAILFFSSITFGVTYFYFEGQYENNLAILQSELENEKNKRVADVDSLQNILALKEEKLKQALAKSSTSPQIEPKIKIELKPNCEQLSTQQIVSCIKHYVNGLSVPAGREIQGKERQKLIGIWNDIDTMCNKPLSSLQHFKVEKNKNKPKLIDM